MTPAKTCGNCKHFHPPEPRGDRIGYWPDAGWCDAPVPMHARDYDILDIRASSDAAACPCHKPKE